MTATSSSAVATPAPPDLGALDRPQREGRITKRNLTGTTPARFRLASLATFALISATALLGFGAARSLTTNSEHAEQSTGPVLVATQDVFASIAEADAASAAVFLSGSAEDREQRRLYELALERSTAQLEEVSRLVGDDAAAHASIKSIAADLTKYSGLVEAARLGNVEGVGGAAMTLTDAIDIVQEGIVPEVQAITAGAQEQLDRDMRGGRAATVIAVLVGLLTLSIIVAGHIFLSRKTNRILNPPLIGAGLLILATSVWLLTAWVQQQNDLELARDGGYESIALTAEIQTTAFRYKTLESLSLISTSDASEQIELATKLAAVDLGSASVTDDARRGEATGQGLLLDANRTADSTREQAATAEMLIRWDRYLRTNQDIGLAVDARELDAAVELAVGAGNADFNGFNTSVESVLSDNRTQFTDGLAQARDRLDRAQVAVVLLPILAAFAALWGYQLRIREYHR